MAETTLVFRFERETKNTVKYAEDAGDGPAVAGSLYVQKWAAKQVGGGGDFPLSLVVTIKDHGGAR